MIYQECEDHASLVTLECYLKVNIILPFSTNQCQQQQQNTNSDVLKYTMFLNIHKYFLYFYLFIFFRLIEKIVRNKYVPHPEKEKGENFSETK